MEKVERLMSGNGMGSHNVSVALYGKGIMELPTSSLAAEFKCVKLRLETILTKSKDQPVKSAATTVLAG